MTRVGLIHINDAESHHYLAYMLEALYVYDLTGRILVDFPIHDSPPAAQVASIVTGPQYDQKPSDLIEVSSSQLVYRSSIGRLVIAVPFRPTSSPLLAEQFIQRFIDAVEAYFGEKFSFSLVNTKSDIITLLLVQMVDGGVPSITEPDILRELVPQQNIIDKLLSGHKENGAAIRAWEYPWRRSEIKHTTDELFVDVIESLTLITGNSSSKGPKRLSNAGSAFYSTGLGRPAKALVCRVRGEIHVLSKLSGVPQVQLDASMPGAEGEKAFPGFHSCVDLELWNSHRLISFVPPDGHTKVMEYVVEVKDPGLVCAEIRRGIGEDRSQFEVYVSVKMDTQVKFIENLAIKIVSPHKVTSFKEIRNSNGDVDASQPSTLEWVFADKVPVGWNATLRGQVSTETGTVQPQYLSVTYQLTGKVPSRTTVRSIAIVNWQDRPKGALYKGVRYQTKTENVVVR